jgi:multicomponent Na+:H+ antiporter subunit G
VTGLVDLASAGLVAVGAVFFMAGTVGLLRFPDLYCRLHALTKADNLGLGLVALGIALQTGGVAPRLQLLLTWLLALVAAATVCHLLARKSLREEGTGPAGEPAPSLRIRP